MDMFAPSIDNIIDNWQYERDLVDNETYNKLTALYKVINCIKPKENDDTRKLWIGASRGTIDDFGDFEQFKEEGIADTFDEFERLWKEYYPNEIKWYSFTTAKYQTELFFYFDSKLIFSIKKNEKSGISVKNKNEEINIFLDWLFSQAKNETEKLKQDVSLYNKYLEKNLSYRKRFGRIKRKDFWDILGDNAIRLDKRLGAEKINKLRQINDESKKNANLGILTKITADDYFKFCEICYNANNYFKGPEKLLSSREKYSLMADGRDAGLRGIEGNSQKTFLDWYHNSDRIGTHPWEICRGGNSTHISLYASYNENKWKLRLAGSSIVRVEETIKMAIALYDKNIPFIFNDAEAIFNMVTGNDYIGIVPDYIIPRYCHSHFPNEDKIIDFMQLSYEEDNIIVSNAYWYPLEKIVINNQ